MFQNGIKNWGLLVLSRLIGSLLFVIIVAIIVWLWVTKPSTPTWSKFLTNRVNSAAFSPDAMLLAVGDNKGNVTIVKEPNKDPSNTITLSTNLPIRITALCFHSDCNTLFAGGSDGIIRIWNVGTEKMEAKLSRHSAEDVVSLAASKDGKYLFSEATAEPILCWSIPEKKVINTIKTDEPSIGTPRFALSPSGNTFATAAFIEKAPTLWNFGAKEITKVRTFLPANEDYAFFCLSFSPDGKRLATGTWHSEVTVWDVASGKEEFSFRIDFRPVVSVAFSQDSNLVAAVQSPTTWFFSYPKLKIWSLVSGNECASVSCSFSGFSVVAFSPDGQGLVTGSVDGWVRYWLLEELIR